MTGQHSEIEKALDLYFDGFYEGSVEKLKRIFHPSCHFYTAADGPLQDDDMESVYNHVETRLSPESRNQKRYDQIYSIDVFGPEAALAKVRIAYGDKLYTDYLSLIHIDGEWRIISKLYTYVLLEVATANEAAD